MDTYILTKLLTLQASTGLAIHIGITLHIGPFPVNNERAKGKAYRWTLPIVLFTESIIDNYNLSLITSTSIPLFHNAFSSVVVMKMR